jgi:hypothetical protein
MGRYKSYELQVVAMLLGVFHLLVGLLALPLVGRAVRLIVPK